MPSKPMVPCEAWVVVSGDGQLLGDEFYRDKAEAEKEVQAHRPLGVTPDCRVARVKISEDWLPIEEAPKDGTPVDLWATWPGSSVVPHRIANAYWRDGEWRHSCGYTWLVPTHFMLLPAPPTEVG